MRRSFLFLQGSCTPFFARLADRLRADGHEIHRINFCAGDAAYWGLRPAWRFARDLSVLRDFLDEQYRRHGITDQILFGDRPLDSTAAHRVREGRLHAARGRIFDDAERLRRYTPHVGQINTGRGAIRATSMC